MQGAVLVHFKTAASEARNSTRYEQTRFVIQYVDTAYADSA